jgi:hypothetical protein
MSSFPLCRADSCGGSGAGSSTATFSGRAMHAGERRARGAEATERLVANLLALRSWRHP